MSARRLLLCAAILLLFANGALAARYQRTKDGQTIVWNSLRGVAQDVTWSGLRDLNGYATGQGTLTWYRLGSLVNSYTGKMVRGKFEGPVIRRQGNTRLQANFVNGEKAGGWSEPGSSSGERATPSPAEETENPEKPLEESPTPAPTARSAPSQTPSPTPTPILKPSPSPTPTPTPTPKASPSPTPTPTPRASPSPTPVPSPTATAIQRPTATPMLRSTPMGMPTLIPTLTPPASTSGPSVETPRHNLDLSSSPAPQLKAEEPAGRESSPSSRTSTAPSAPAGARKIDPNLKRQIIADFKKKIDFVFGQVRDATGNFREVDRLEQVRNLPPSVSAHVTLLANQAREFRAVLGYEVTYYECLAEIQTVDALGIVDEATRDIAAKDTPSARKTLEAFRTRYSEPTGETQKPLWRYLVSLFSLCERLKTEAEGHLQRALSLQSAGKKADALQEYREIERIYPNPITAEKIRQLESQSP